MVTLRKPKRSRAIIYLFECESKPYFYLLMAPSLQKLLSLAKKKRKTKQQQKTTDKQTK